MNIFGLEKKSNKILRQNALILSELSYYLKDLDQYFRDDNNKAESPYLYSKYVEFVNVINAIVKRGK